VSAGVGASMHSSVRRGVYFLANDRVLDLVIAFLNSFRVHNPTMPLCLVPFDDGISRVLEYRERFGFSVYQDSAKLERCDAIGRLLHGRTVGHYRKLAIWEGEFDEFIYIDVDTVVLAAVDFVFGFLQACEFVTSHSNHTSLERWVWKRSIRRSGELREEQWSYSANTGFVASKVGAMTLDAAEAGSARALMIRRHMNLQCQEQPFLNYLIVTSGGRYASLAALASAGSPFPMKLEFWAGRRGATIKGGQLLPPKGRPPVLLVHWAGQWQARMRDRLWRLCLRAVGVIGTDRGCALRVCLPYGRLWSYYRHLDGQGKQPKNLGVDEASGQTRVT
jgi:hypothetical protein